MKCEIDGDCLCVTNDYFINLQESDAVFIHLTEKQIIDINALGE